MNRKIAFFALLTMLTLPAGAADRTGAKAIRAPIGQFPIAYQLTGLRDDGSPSSSGVATTFHCTNPTAFPANVQFVIYNFDGTLAVNQTFSLTKFQTFTASTHNTVLYDEDVTLGSGVLNQGYVQLRSDNLGLLCGAEVVDASSRKNFAVTLLARSARGE